MPAAIVRNLVEKMLAPQGPLPAHCEQQRTLAYAIAEALDAPPQQGALVTPIQAATGTGKTIAVLAPLMARAALQKKQQIPPQRALLSTFTNYLTRQILEEDAPKVNAALQQLGYAPLRVAARAGRRQFIDTERVEQAALQLEGNAAKAEALMQLYNFETFAEAEEQQIFVPAGFTNEQLCLTPRSSRNTAAVFTRQKEDAAKADLVLTNHALALLDCRFRGGLLGSGETVNTVVFDEADTLPDVARSLADERIGLPWLEEICKGAGAKAKKACRELAQLCEQASARGPQLLKHCTEAARITELAETIRTELKAAANKRPPNDEWRDEAHLLQKRLKYFLEQAREALESAGEKRPYALAVIAAWPVPALTVIHRQPVRLLRYIFENTRAAFFTSATLAAPANDPHPNDLLNAFGIGAGMETPARINYKGWRDLQPKKYGRMSFYFADRAAPHPFIRATESESGQADPEHLAYVASAIVEARNSGRVLVLCTSYQMVDELAALVPNATAHERGKRLGSYRESFANTADGVLLTPAAWAGLSWPNVIDHVVIPRIPFPPPSEINEAKREFLSQLGFAETAVTGMIMGDGNKAARRKLAQGIGRGIRGPKESCTLWLLDPRFPLPGKMARRFGGPGYGLAKNNQGFLNCIPKRFLERPFTNPAINQGKIWPLPPG